MSGALNDYTTIIRSGVTPAPEGTGQLSRERAEQLDADLRALQEHRAQAAVESRSYVLVARGYTPPDGTATPHDVTAQPEQGKDTP